MTDATAANGSKAPTAEHTIAERITVVSVDAHVAPPVEDYRPFLETAHLDAFDHYVAEVRGHMAAHPGANAPFNPTGFEQSDRTRAYWDEIATTYNSPTYYSDAVHRLQAMDDDGIAVELSFHGGFNREPIPFFFSEVQSQHSQVVPTTPEAAVLRNAGLRAYNRWFAAWSQADPLRLMGVALIPIWDVEAAVAEVEQAAELGFRAVNLPSPKAGVLTYNRPEYEPLWAACEAHDMTLHSHVGEGQKLPIDPGPGAYSMHVAEVAENSRRHLPHMVFGGVFERHPSLRSVYTEQMGTWYGRLFAAYDSIYSFSKQECESPHIQELLPRLPSEYVRQNVFVCSSCASRQEVQGAIDGGYVDQTMWGRDYPHPEGTWPATREHYRATFAGFPDDVVRAILGRNAIRVLALDRQAIDAIGERIGPRSAEVQTPLAGRPDGARLSMGFRTIGPHA